MSSFRQSQPAAKFRIISVIRDVHLTWHGACANLDQQRQRKRDGSYENQFIIIGNPASFNSNNFLDSHFSSRFGISSILDRHRMVSSSTPSCRSMTPTDSESLDSSVMPHRSLKRGRQSNENGFLSSYAYRFDCLRRPPGRGSGVWPLLLYSILV